MTFITFHDPHFSPSLFFLPQTQKSEQISKQNSPLYNNFSSNQIHYSFFFFNLSQYQNSIFFSFFPIFVIPSFQTALCIYQLSPLLSSLLQPPSFSFLPNNSHHANIVIQLQSSFDAAFRTTTFSSLCHTPPQYPFFPCTQCVIYMIIYSHPPTSSFFITMQVSHNRYDMI